MGFSKGSEEQSCQLKENSVLPDYFLGTYTIFPIVFQLSKIVRVCEAQTYFKADLSHLQNCQKQLQLTN